MRSRRWAGAVFCWLLIILGAVLLGSAWWIRRTFGPVSMIQLRMHMPTPDKELTATEVDYLVGYLQTAVAIPVGIVLVVGLTLRYRRRRREGAAGPDGRAGATRTAGRRPRWWVALAIPLIGAVVLSQTIGLPQHIRWLTSTQSMQPYYTVPATAANEKPKNLVVIYLESIEASFADDSTFEVSMTEPLDDATAGWASIEDLTMYPSGGWTMAGIVGTECGIPLRGPGTGKSDLNSNDIGGGKDGYLPGAVCLGDVLSAEGYTTRFMGGADANFANKTNFLHDHGYQEVMDAHTWNARGETEQSIWGLSDRRLMENAKTEVTRLHEADEPFLLSMITLDSHEPAHRYPGCERTTKVKMSSVIRCSMAEVAGFVDYMDEQGYLDDTVVLITGDHPKMVTLGGAYHEELSGIPPQERALYNRIWSPDGVPIVRHEMDQLSLYPTLLDLLGYGEPDHRAGVGVSALVQDSPGSMLDLPSKEYADVVQSRSPDMYRTLWSRPPDSPVAAAEP